jgi:hypothetical protein
VVGKEGGGGNECHGPTGDHNPPGAYEENDERRGKNQRKNYGVHATSLSAGENGWVSESFHRPALFGGAEFAAFQGGADPAELNLLAQESARRLLARARHNQGESLERAVAFTDENGLDDLAELWANSSPQSLPGVLWRLYVVRELIRRESAQMSILYAAGLEHAGAVDALVAGAPTPAGPDEMRQLADTILRGAFVGDFAVALQRAGAFCAVLAAGCTAQADEAELLHPHRASALTTQALRLSTTAQEFRACARKWRDGSLD